MYLACHCNCPIAQWFYWEALFSLISTKHETLWTHLSSWLVAPAMDLCDNPLVVLPAQGPLHSNLSSQWKPKWSSQSLALLHIPVLHSNLKGSLLQVTLNPVLWSDIQGLLQFFQSPTSHLQPVRTIYWSLNSAVISHLCAFSHAIPRDFS